MIVLSSSPFVLWGIGCGIGIGLYYTVIVVTWRLYWWHDKRKRLNAQKYK